MWQVVLLSFIISLLTACGGTTDETPTADNTAEEVTAEQETEESVYPYTFVDGDGKELVIEEAPQTIVSLVPSNTEILYELGLEEEIIGVTDNDNFPPGVEEKESVGSFDFSVEKIVALNPQMVVAHEMNLSAGPDAFDQIRDAGIQVVVIPNAETFEETYETIDLLGKINDKTAEAENVIQAMKDQISAVQEKTAGAEEKTVFVESSDIPEIYTPGQGTFIQEMLDLINAKNIVTEEGWIMIDPEKIVSENPETIIVMYDYVPNIIDSVTQRDGFSSITAVKEKRVMQVDEDLLSRVGPRLAEGLEELARAIHPEAFDE